jgi:predicted ATPase
MNFLNFKIFILCFFATSSLLSTEKYILTGGPGAGKTSIILAIEFLGEIVVKESAIDIILLDQANGIKEPWTLPDFKERILNLQIQRENQILPNVKRAFLDRSPIDLIAYYIFEKKTVPASVSKAVHELIEKKEYKKVFLIENLGIDIQSNQRIENIETAIKLEKLHEKIYKDLGFVVIKIPPGPLTDRVNTILKNL